MSRHERPLPLRLAFPILVSLCLAGAASALGAGGDDYPSLDGTQPIKTVFDVRTANPKSAAIFLELIHRSLTDPGLANVDASPEFVVSFIGPAVRLITTSREGLAPEEAEQLDVIGARIAAMARDGIELEFCLYAAGLAGVDPATVPASVTPVENGWISLMGYQANGYSLIPVY